VGGLTTSALAEEKKPEPCTPAQLAERTLYRRAVEAVIWGMPAVNFDLMFQAVVRDTKAGAGSNKIVYWWRLSDWRNQILTPNPDSIYFMPFFRHEGRGTDGARDSARR
jgi:hypothetical protein